MRIPITDKFLWDLYNFFEKAGKVASGPGGIFLLKSWQEACNPLLFEFWRDYHEKQEKKQFAQFINYLKSRGYIKIKNLEGKTGILLTKKGEEKALKSRFKFAEKKKRKDGKWIMVIFDIPEKKKSTRNSFRKTLQWLGYQKLQKSIWICPYDVLRETEKIIKFYQIEPYVKIFLISEVEI